MGSIVASGIAVFVVVPLFRKVFGRKWFADDSGLNGCYLFLWCNVVAFFLVILIPDFWAARARIHNLPYPQPNASFYLTVPILVFVLLSVYCVAWSIAQCLCHRRVGFRICADGSILNAKGIVLHPTAVQKEYVTQETSISSRFGTYHLTLYAGAEKLATNVYMAAEFQEADFKNVVSQDRTPRCRSLDLEFVWRYSRLEWLTAGLSSDWTMYLCQPEDYLSGESSAFWNSLTLPVFDFRTRPGIDPKQLRLRLAELERTILPLAQGHAHAQSLRMNLTTLMAIAERSSGTIIPTTRSGFDAMIEEAGGRDATTEMNFAADRPFNLTIVPRDRSAKVRTEL